MFSFVEDDEASILEVTCKDRNGDPINLTTALAVKVFYRINGGALQNKTMTKDPDQVTNTGVARYQWLTGELSPAGQMVCEIEITDALNAQLTSNRTLTFLIRERI